MPNVNANMKDCLFTPTSIMLSWKDSGLAKGADTRLSLILATLTVLLLVWKEDCSTSSDAALVMAGLMRISRSWGPAWVFNCPTEIERLLQVNTETQTPTNNYTLLHRWYLSVLIHAHIHCKYSYQSHFSGSRP